MLFCLFFPITKVTWGSQWELTISCLMRMKLLGSILFDHCQLKHLEIVLLILLFKQTDWDIAFCHALLFATNILVLS